MEVMEAMEVNSLLELPGGVLCRILSFGTAATLAKLRKCCRGVLQMILHLAIILNQL